MKLYYHKLGDKQEKDVMLFEYPEEPDAVVNGHLSNDGKYLLISLHKGSGQQELLYYADMREEENKNLDRKLKVKPVVDKWVATFSYIHNLDDQFFFQTDRNAPM